jgi:hypothetical protein
MPVRKFRSLQEMEDSLWRRSDDPALADAIARVWGFADRVCPLRFPPGVHEHRSIDEAQQLRDQWQEADFRAYWESKNSAW